MSIGVGSSRGFHSSARKSNWDLMDFKAGGRSSESGITATVFGCTGFLGKQVVNNIGKIGSRVVVPYRGDGMEARPLKMMGDLGQIIAVPIDVRDQDSIDKAVSKSNVVINCIGNTMETRNFSFRNTYVDTNKAIIDACNKAGVQRYINVSAVNASLDSESPWLQANAEADLLVHSEFPDATTIKVTRMFGAMDKFINQFAGLANQSPVTPLINNGEQRVQPIYVNDVAEAITAAMLKPEAVGQTYYLGGPETLVLKDLINDLQENMYIRTHNIAPVPMKAARLFGYGLQNLRMVLPPFSIITEDDYIQMQYDNVVPNVAGGVLGIQDLLEHEPKKLSGPVLEQLAHIHRGERGPEVTSSKGRRTWDEVKI